MLVSCLCLNILYTYMQCYHNTSGVGPCWEEGHHLCWDRGEPTVRRNQGPRVPWASLHILWGGQSSSRPHTYWSHVSSLWQRGVSWGTKSKWWLSTDIVCGIWSTLNTELSYNILYAIIIFLFVAIVYKKGHQLNFNIWHILLSYVFRYMNCDFPFPYFHQADNNYVFFWPCM